MNRFKLLFLRHFFNKTPDNFILFVAKILGIKIGVNSFFRTPDYVDTLNFSIGKNSFINKDLFVYSHNYTNAKITIGDNVFIGPKVKMVCVDHKIGSSRQRAGEHIERPIIIGNGAWIGMNVTIMPGVVIGEGCVIAANSTVLKNTHANELYVGTPAKSIRKLN
ncbi:acyltransferase [Pediococcus ethanolidurans]|uniref:Maltose O-acetyltransferase n=2 Tax=Pediococcus ethanolidurans TaxID=319653 RepID=A0A1H9QJW6_9LACO|nr:DapH/DapD/GlmU-related protein [Pediococcus ethanolidurans]GEN95250.1 hypothetical protein PET01_13000 [Pediococcus ethanolidurans]SER60796.1 maltose O-acetyltransferase [Pediococcus ethanolidurans]